jgi:hypothetical protein
MQSIPMRANTPLTSHIPEPLSGSGSKRNVKPLCFATAAIDSSTKADDRGQPIDLSRRRVRFDQSPPGNSRRGRRGLRRRPALARWAATKQVFAFASRSMPSSAAMMRASLSTWTGSAIVRSTLSSHTSAATKPVNFALQTERLVAFFHHAHSSSVLLKVILEQLRRSCR